MSPQTFTPGPWHFSDDGTIRGEVSALKNSNLMGDYRGPIIADIQYSVNCRSTEWGEPTARSHAIREARANAALIAAAPSLWNAVTGLLACPDLNLDELEPETREAIGYAVAALRKAEGDE